MVIASAANMLHRLEQRLQRAARVLIVPFVDDFVDVCRWMWRARKRRQDRKPGAHRMGDRSLTIWDIYHRMSDTELANSGCSLAREPGLHRDARGWRHAPATWKQIPVWEMERKAEECALESLREINRLMDEIQEMLANPPQPETLHGCKNCLCGLVPA